MQNRRGGGRLSLSMLQSAVGLMILATLGCLAFLVLWVTNFNLKGRSYRATILFPNAGGITQGTRVAYRGVKVGQVVSINPEPEGVAIGVEISPGERLIPSNSTIEAIQSGLVGETSIDITPLQTLPDPQKIAPPLDANCNRDLIICEGSHLKGEGKLDVNALIRSLLRISNILGNPEVVATIKTTTQNASSAMREISAVLNKLNKTGSVDKFNSALLSVDETSEDLRNVSKEISSLLSEARQSGGINNFNSTLVSVGEAAEEIRRFLAINQTRLATTLDSIGKTSDSLKLTVGRLNPVIDQVESSKLITNLDTMSENAVELTTNLKDFSANLNDPQNILMLQQILDSARSVFENVDKITSDVDELTGNPQFRKDLEKLIQGLSNLVSSTQQLQQQVEYSQVLTQAAAQIDTSQVKDNLPAAEKKTSPPNPVKVKKTPKL